MDVATAGLLSDEAKRQNGAYFTRGDPFGLEPFQAWADKADISDKPVLEPFAGANHIIRALQGHGYANSFASYDIMPDDPEVSERDTLKDFPSGFDIAVTNPPWLARNSAKRRGLAYPETIRDDLYKHCLDICLDNCEFVAALIPATFLQSNAQHERLETFILLQDRDLFADTDNPVALALFSGVPQTTEVYCDSKLVGTLEDLRTKLPAVNPSREISTKPAIRFNDPQGILGFIAFDNTKEPSIRFCRSEDLNGYQVSHSSRMITRISVPFGQDLLDRCVQQLNHRIAQFRNSTSDVLLTPFKGLRSDGKYRRRMDYALARAFIEEFCATS